MPKLSLKLAALGSALGVVLIVAAHGHVCPSIWTQPSAPAEPPSEDPPAERKRPPLSLGAGVPQAMLTRVRTAQPAAPSPSPRVGAVVATWSGSDGVQTSAPAEADIEPWRRDAWRRDLVWQIAFPDRAVRFAARDPATGTCILIHAPPNA